MGKYLQVFRIGIQNTLVYRVNFLFRAAIALVPLTGTLYLWKSIYAGKAAGADVAGYALSQMISYYLLTTLVDAFTAVAEDDWQIAADIKDGHISQFLIRPIRGVDIGRHAGWVGLQPGALGGLGGHSKVSMHLVMDGTAQGPQGPKP